MKKIFYTMAMALLVFTGCSEEDTIEQSINPFARFSATIEQQSPVSRVEINPNNTMNFSVGDIARIFTTPAVILYHIILMMKFLRQHPVTILLGRIWIL